MKRQGWSIRGSVKRGVAIRAKSGAKGGGRRMKQIKRGATGKMKYPGTLEKFSKRKLTSHRSSLSHLPPPPPLTPRYFCLQSKLENQTGVTRERREQRSFSFAVKRGWERYDPRDAARKGTNLKIGETPTWRERECVNVTTPLLVRVGLENCWTSD